MQGGITFCPLERIVLLDHCRREEMLLQEGGKVIWLKMMMREHALFKNKDLHG